MKQKVPLFIPAENFIPIEKENLSIQTQQLQSLEGASVKDNFKSVHNKLESKQIDQQSMNQNETLKQQEKQRSKYSKAPSISNNNANGNQFDDNDFLITEDNCENGIAANLQSLDMKRYSDRNNYFNNSIRVFNLQKNKSQVNFTSNSNPTSNINLNIDTPLNTNNSQKLDLIYNKNNSSQSKQSGISYEFQQSTRLTNESSISNRHSELSLQPLNYLDQKMKKDQQNSLLKLDQQTSSNTGQINILSQSTISSVSNSKQLLQSQNNELQKQTPHLPNTVTQNKKSNLEAREIKEQKKESTNILNEQNQIQTTYSPLDDRQLKQESQFYAQNSFGKNEQEINQIQLFKESNRQKTASFQQIQQQMLTSRPSLNRGRQQCLPTDQLKEDISPSPTSRSNIELQNEQRTHLLYITNNNDMMISETNRNRKQPLTLFVNNDGLSLFPENNQGKDQQEQKFHEIINDEANLQEDQLDNIIDLQDDSMSQNRGEIGKLQKHSIMNSNLNIFVVKKNAISSPQSARVASMDNKFTYFNQQNEDQKYAYESDTSINKISFSKCQAHSDLNPIRNTGMNRNVFQRVEDDDHRFTLQDISISRNDDQHNNTTDNEQIKEISQILRHAEREDLKSFPQTPNNIQSEHLLTQFFRDQPEIIKSIFQNEITPLKKLIQGFSNQQKNTIDAHGNTLLYIATKLALKEDKYFDIFKFLLQNGGNPKIRNKEGWSPLDEAIFQKNVKITTTLFEYIYQSKKKKISEQFKQLDTILPTLPDCYIEIKWHFESMIPFLGYFAPSDTFRFWKVGTNFRLDTTLVGFNNLKCKRRNMSLIFKKQELFLINKSNKTVTNPQEQLDTEEKKKIIQDLLESKPFNSSFDVTQCNVTQSKTWNGKIVKKKIANYNAEQYCMKLIYEYVYKNKSAIGESIYESNEKYQKSLKVYKGDELEPPKRASSICNSTMNSQNKKETFITSNSKEKETKKATFSLWMSKDYPIHFKQFLPVLQVLERSNPILQKLNEFLSKDEVKNLFQNEGFPVKIQIPLNYTIKSTIDFSDFKFLDKKSENIQDLFNIDPTYQVVPRKVAQKTLTRTKKRMILANMITA